MPRRSTCRWFAAIAAALLLSACQPDAPGAGPPADADPARPDAGNEYTPGDVEAPAWLNPLSGDLAEVDLQTPGSLGVYVRHLGDGAGSLDMGDDEAWYLGATVRVAVAIAVLEQVDAGNLGLDETIALREADLVDGPGTLRSRPPGEEFTIAALLEKSLRDGDTVATDMLIRRVGEVDLNRRVREWIGRGFGQVTTHLQERYAAYGGLHPGVAKLTNTDMIRVQEAGEGEARLDQLAALLDVERDDLAHASLEGVFEEFHATGSNAWPLEMFADMLEQLVTGQLLSPASMRRLLDHMRAARPAGGGIEDGLPSGTDFAAASGTGFQRACQAGVLGAADPGQATIVVACIRDFGEPENAGRALQAVGRALSRAGLA